MIHKNEDAHRADPTLARVLASLAYHKHLLERRASAAGDYSRGYDRKCYDKGVEDGEQDGYQAGARAIRGVITRSLGLADYQAYRWEKDLRDVQAIDNLFRNGLAKLNYRAPGVSTCMGRLLALASGDVVAYAKAF